MIPTKTLPFDAANYLGSRRAQAQLLSDALDTRNAAYMAHALGVIARAQGISEIMPRAGITGGTLEEALADAGNPRLITVLSVIDALGFTLVVRAAK